MVTDLLRNIKLTLQYDGSDYHGWQVQDNAVTIQSVVEAAIEKITGQKSCAVGCGRTDSGVHALGYICNFRSDTKIPAEKIPYALNANLPGDIVCIKAEDAKEDFHAKSSAVKKRYTYFINNSPFPDIFSHSWHVRYPLDLSAMQEAAKAFLGEHDFLGFASSGFSVKTTVRTIYSLDVTKENNLIIIDITGNGFLYNMVRIIAGTLVYAGSGRLAASDMPEIIASRDRSRAGITAPADGLFLSEVYYEE